MRSLRTCALCLFGLVCLSTLITSQDGTAAGKPTKTRGDTVEVPSKEAFAALKKDFEVIKKEFEDLKAAHKGRLQYRKVFFNGKGGDGWNLTASPATPWVYSLPKNHRIECLWLTVDGFLVPPFGYTGFPGELSVKDGNSIGLRLNATDKPTVHTWVECSIHVLFHEE